MPEYGLTGFRDAEGKRKPQEHTFEWKGEEVRIKLIPPSTGELEEYENLGDDVDVSRLEEIVDRHLVRPDVDPSDLTAVELFAYLDGIVDYCRGDMDGMAGEAQAELESRNAAGN